MAQKDFQKQDEKLRIAAERNLAKCADLVIGGGRYRDQIFRAAICYERAGDYDLAIQWLDELAKYAPSINELASLVDRIGDCHHKKGHLAKAKEAFEEAAQYRNMGDNAVINLLADQNSDSSDQFSGKEYAAIFLKLAVDNFEIEGNWLAAANAGFCLFRHQSRRHWGHTLRTIGENFIQAGELQQSANVLYRAAIYQTVPSDKWETLTLLGRIYEEMERPLAAAKAFEAAARYGVKNSDKVFDFEHAGNNYEILRNFRAAARDFFQAAKYETNIMKKVHNFERAAYCCYKYGNYQAAAHANIEAAEWSPDLRVKALLWAHAGNSYKRCGYLGQAAHAYDQAVLHHGQLENVDRDFMDKILRNAGDCHKQNDDPLSAADAFAGSTQYQTDAKHQIRNWIRAGKGYQKAYILMKEAQLEGEAYGFDEDRELELCREKALSSFKRAMNLENSTWRKMKIQGIAGECGIKIDLYGDRVSVSSGGIKTHGLTETTSAGVRQLSPDADLFAPV